MNDKQRKIIHIDMDCFYAAIEARDNPALRGKPIAVGGRPDKRGVVATCSYEARAFGIHSAMPMAQAIKKCPALIVVPVRMQVYQQVSKQIQTIFTRYTSIIQPLSLDEAFLDVSDCKMCKGSATLIAHAIRKQIFAEHDLTASAGISVNKFLAKIGSDWNKPNGQFVLTADKVDAFIKPLSVKKIYGVGKVTAKKMHAMGLDCCEDLQQLSEAELTHHFGKFGSGLYRLCRGIDDRPVQTKSIRKSISVEDTYVKDLPKLENCLAETKKLYDSLLNRLKRSQKKEALQIKAYYVKVRFNNFQTTTAQTSQGSLSLYSYRELISKAWHRQQRPVRLLGLGIQFHAPETPRQTEIKFLNQS